MLKQIVVTLCLVLFNFSVLSAMPRTASDGAVITGKVVETMNSGGYTYMLVDSSGSSQWVAIPETPVKKGQEVRYYEGMEMKQFKSSTLGRIFDSIIFSNGLVTEPSSLSSPAEGVSKAQESDDFAAAVAREQEAAIASAPSDVPQLSGGSMGAIVPLKDLTVEKAGGENGYTVGEIFDKAAELDAKTVRVRGKVVKFNPQIMGRNWIHIQDGTGDPMRNRHDLVITTTEEAKVDEIVTVEGKLAANKDFGAGYRYEVIIEKASLTR